MPLGVTRRFYCRNVAGCVHARADRPFSDIEYEQSGGLCKDDAGAGCGQPLVAGASVDRRPWMALVASIAILPIGVAGTLLYRSLFPAPLTDFAFLAPASDVVDTAAVVEVAVHRRGPSDDAAEVRFETMEDTARPKQDYVAQAGALRFGPGEREKKIVLGLVADPTFQRPVRHFRVRLTNVEGAPEHLVKIGPAASARSDALAAEQAVRSASVIAKDVADLFVRRRTLDALLDSTRERKAEYEQYKASLTAVTGNLSRAREAYLQQLRDLQTHRPKEILDAMDRVSEDLRGKGFEQQSAAVLVMKRHYQELIASAPADMDRWAQELSAVVPSILPAPRSRGST